MIKMPDNLGLRLHMIMSRISREDGDPEETSTLGEAAAHLLQLEQVMRDLLALMGEASYLEMHPAVRRAREIIGGS